VLLESPEFGVGDTNAYCRPDFVMFQTYQIDCFTMQQKADQPHNSDSVVKSTSSTSTKPLQVENSTFFGKDAGKNTAQNSSKRQFKRKKNQFFLSSPRPVQRGGVPSPHPTLAPSPSKPCGSAFASPRIPARFTPLVLRPVAAGVQLIANFPFICFIPVAT